MVDTLEQVLLLISLYYSSNLQSIHLDPNYLVLPRSQQKPNIKRSDAIKKEKLCGIES